MSANADESKHDWVNNLCRCEWKRIPLGYGRFRYFHTVRQVAVIRRPSCVAPVPHASRRASRNDASSMGDA